MKKFAYSLGDYIVDNYGEDFLNKIWSDKNIKSAYEYFPNSGKKAWFKCANGIHEDEERKIDNATRRGYHCRQCSIIEQHEEQKKPLIGQKFGKLFVRDYYLGNKENSKDTYYICDCDCGAKDIIVYRGNLVKGASKSGGCLRHENSGEKNWNWKGGVTPAQMKARNSYGYGKWRDAVFEYDDYTCQCCGQRGGKLNAHHINNFSDYENQRFDVNNGITLCENCHAFKIKGSFHDIYGTKNNTPEQLEEYINHNLTKLGSDIKFSIDEYINCKMSQPQTA